MSAQITLKEFIEKAREGDVTAKVYLLIENLSSTPQTLVYSKKNNRLEIYYTLSALPSNTNMSASKFIGDIKAVINHQSPPSLATTLQFFSVEAIMDIIESTDLPDDINSFCIGNVFVRLFHIPLTTRHISFLTNQKVITEALRLTQTESSVIGQTLKAYARIPNTEVIPKPLKLLILKHV